MFLRIMSYRNPLNIDIQVPKDHLRTKLTKKTEFLSKMERQSLHQHSISQEKKLTKKELVELEYREQYRGYLLTHLYQNQYSISCDQSNSIHAAYSSTTPCQRTFLQINLITGYTYCRRKTNHYYTDSNETTKQSLHQYNISQFNKLTKKELVELEDREQYRGYSLTHLYPNQYSISSDQTNSIYAECPLSSTIFQMALIICEIGNLLRQRTLFSVNFTFVKI